MVRPVYPGLDLHSPPHLLDAADGDPTMVPAGEPLDEIIDGEEGE